MTLRFSIDGRAAELSGAAMHRLRRLIQSEYYGTSHSYYCFYEFRLDTFVEFITCIKEMKVKLREDEVKKLKDALTECLANISGPCGPGPYFTSQWSA